MLLGTTRDRTYDMSYGIWRHRCSPLWFFEVPCGPLGSLVVFDMSQVRSLAVFNSTTNYSEPWTLWSTETKFSDLRQQSYIQIITRNFNYVTNIPNIASLIIHWISIIENVGVSK